MRQKGDGTVPWLVQAVARCTHGLLTPSPNIQAGGVSNSVVMLYSTFSNCTAEVGADEHDRFKSSSSAAWGGCVCSCSFDFEPRSCEF
jgi:hypothetical protein